MAVTDKYEVHGVDISKWQGSINADIMATANDFVVIRLGDGVYKTVDQQYFDYSNQLRLKAGRGSYWFFRGNIDGVEQAKIVESGLRREKGELPYFVDVEVPDIGYIPVSVDQYRQMLVEHLAYMDNYLNKPAGIYSSAGSWQALLGGNLPQNFKGTKLKYAITDRPLWVAHWDVFSPMCPGQWADRWSIWQYSKKGPGKENGLASFSKVVDKNVYRHAKSRFKVDYGITFETRKVSETRPPKALKIGRSTVGGRIRTAPNEISGAIIGAVIAGSIWPIVDVVKDIKGDSWCKVAEGVYISSKLGDYVYE